MKGDSTVLKDISEKVHAFCDDIIAGKVDDELLQRHKIPYGYLDVCRDSNHPSSKKLRDRLFEHLMGKTGAYYNLTNETALKEIYSKIDELLMNPQEDSKERPLYVPRFIYGVKHALESIERLNHAKTIDFAEKPKVGNVRFEKNERSFHLTYSKDPRVSVSLEDYSAPATKIKIDGLDIDVPEGGAHLSSYQRNFTQDDEVEIQFGKFHHSCLKDENPYYFRYVTEVNTKYYLQRNFVVCGFDVEGTDVFAIDTLVEGNQLLLYFVGYSGKRYLIIDYQTKVTAKEMSDLTLSNALPEFPSDVFGRLVEKMRKYEELQRGIFIILMGSKLHLEIQAATYCVALEAISNLAPKIIGQKEEHIINDKKTWKEVKKRFNALTEDLCRQQIISAEEKQSVKKKIENLNKAFNSEKLRALLEYYHYPLRQFDELTLLLRNLLLHGNIKFKVLKGRHPVDYLFELSMNLHKLCCAIALLMSGYKGYIVNNRKLYGFPNSYKAFIRIGDNVKID